MISLEVVDPLGHIIRREQRFVDVNGRLEASMDLQKFSAGTYFLRMTTPEGSSQKKFVVE
jgi:hypothetical protein